MPATPSLLTSLTGSPHLRQSRRLLWLIRSWWEAHRHGARAKSQRTLPWSRDSCPCQHKRPQQTLRDESANLKTERGANPRIERYVAADDADGRYHADSWTCKQENSGERVEEGQHRSVCKNDNGHFTVVPVQPMLEKNANALTPARCPLWSTQLVSPCEPVPMP